MSEPVANYNPALPTARDKLRFKLGDTNTGAALIPDVTYDAVLSVVGGDEKKAAVALLDHLISRFAQLPNSTTADDGAVRIEWKDRVATWRAMRGLLQAEIEAEAVTPSEAAPLRSLKAKVRPVW